MTRKYINLKVIAMSETELSEFLGLCSVIQYLGEAGANREVKLRIDGDGSARFKFFVNDEELTTPNLDANNLPSIYIGE